VAARLTHGPRRVPALSEMDGPVGTRYYHRANHSLVPMGWSGLREQPHVG